ncbi:hypothetical protein [Streptomyces sp. CC224B]|uniref:hypothetical protein n=1 Tax=Streptomyces sp. CC224B TaxID=3044571 RepID=UPI0024A9C423|nr:hypothetical protein [Streptomyces sp. CC224B]
MGQIDALRAEIVPGLGPLLAVTARAFGDLMNCSFGRVDIWPDSRGGTSDVHCEGPLRG